MGNIYKSSFPPHLLSTAFALLYGCLPHLICSHGGCFPESKPQFESDFIDCMHIHCNYCCPELQLSQLFWCLVHRLISFPSLRPRLATSSGLLGADDSAIDWIPYQARSALLMTKNIALGSNQAVVIEGGTPSAPRKTPFS